jgi:tripartite-type tricarboxylate transporter receptor subunit TctC
MILHRLALRGWLLAVAILLGFAPLAHAQFPDRTVKLVVAYPPGGATDVIARLLAKQLSAQWNQQVVVENKPGATGMVGAESVARAAPDGYTLLLGYAPEVALNKLVFKSMTYDPATDLVPLSLVATAPLVLATGPKLPFTSIKQFAERKGASVPLTYGSPGIGGQQHIAGELLGIALGIPVTQVQYKGTGPAVTDLLGGQIDFFFATTPPLLQHIQAGKLKAVAIAGPKREPLLPDVPTMVELGYPKIQLMNWFGLFAPKGLPQPLADKITADVQKALADPTLVQALQAQGLSTSQITGSALRDFMASEMNTYRGFIAETKITAN